MEPADWRPNAGPQTRFLRSTAFEALYGGAAGGGKSTALLAGALRFVEHPAYSALILRRTIPELKLAKGLMEIARDLCPRLGGQATEGGKTWLFPSGARLDLTSMEHEDDRFRFASSAYQYIAFDELTSFTERQYRFMLSRLRGADPAIPLRLRAGSNPGGPGHDWVLQRFAPWLYPRPDAPDHDPSYEGPHAAPEERVWYRYDALRGEEVICDRYWSDASCPDCTADAACVPHRPLARAFFPALIADNPWLVGTAYEAGLDQLDPVARLQLKFGSWMARPAAGAYFQRGWFAKLFLDARPTFVRGRVRYWDRAATADPRADYTAGILMSRTREGGYVVEHMVRGQWDPGEVEAQIEATANIDPQGTRIVLEKDPGQAGKAQVRHDARALDGHDLGFAPPIKDKLSRMRPVSSQARAGNIQIVRGSWNEAFFRELESCPEGRWDQIDALSGAYHQLLVLSGVKSTTRGSREAVAGRMGGIG